MSIRHIIIILCFFLTGCFPHYLVSDVEFNARNHMELAAAKENSSNFQEAIQEYAIISEKYPDTSYYKTAVWRAALLNLHPNNPEINYKAAQDWLQIYLKLPLSPEEKEIAVLYNALILQINVTLDEKNKLLTNTKRQNKNMAILTQKLKQAQIKAAKARGELKKLSSYEAELSILKDKLKKMKEIDVQLHKTRKGSNNKSFESD
ncbi:MAG: hypothetical protein K8S18_11160 [Desulfobacula sp.]|nr:hypothetical protein [Desulfobacula sp.]